MVTRPARLGLLVDAEVKGLHWLRMFEGALAAQSQVWGGQFNLILPLTKDFTDQELFWRLTDLFDADSFLAYAPTWGELKIITPGFYEEQMSSWRKEIASKSSDDEASRFISSAQSEAAFHPKVPKEQIQLIEKRLSPLSDPGPAERDLSWFNAASSASWPLTDISEFQDLPKAVANPEAHSGAARQLLLTSLQGRVPSAFRKVLEERDVEIQDMPVSKFDWLEIVRKRVQMENTVLPWKLTMAGLATYRTGGFTRTPAALVVGNSPWDFCLYYFLLRLTGSAWWLPSWLAADPIYKMALESSIEFEPRNEARTAVVTSVSSPAMSNRVAHSLQLRSGQLDVADWSEVLPDEPLRVLSDETPGRARLVPLVKGEVLELDTPIPTGVRTRVPAEMRWLTEARSNQWEPIRNRKLGGHLMPGESDILRTSRNGVAYFSTSSFIFTGASLESAVVRPGLRRLSLGQQVAFLLNQQGWKCEASDKAIYAQESIKLFGGFEDLCDALRDKSIRSIINAFRGKPPIAPRLSHDNRRYLTYDHFKQLLGEANVRSVIDPLLDKEVLARGVVLKCTRCRQAAWHSAATVADAFTCSRCGLAQDVDRDAWFGTAEPRLSYRLAEVVFQLLEHDGELPLLATNDAFLGTRRPVGRGYELSVTSPDGQVQEVDIFQSDGYRLWIGEASVKAEFSDDRLVFLAELVDALDAYGVLLATSRSKWSSHTEERALKVFPGPWPRLRLLAGVRTAP
jgi:hypothetical protein